MPELWPMVSTGKIFGERRVNTSENRLKVPNIVERLEYLGGGSLMTRNIGSCTLRQDKTDVQDKWNLAQ